MDLIAQWKQAKEHHPGMLLLFRMGDFYEAYNEDARTIAHDLKLTLTAGRSFPDMAGFPHHCLETYLQKLLKLGYRVAVCEPISGSVIDHTPPAKAPKKRQPKAKPAEPEPPKLKRWLVLPAGW